MSHLLNQSHLVTVGAAGDLSIWLPWVGPVLLVVFALWLVAPLWRRRMHATRQRRAIERLASACVRDAVFPNGVDGMTQVDYLLLTATGIVVADVKRYQGYLFGGENIKQWTQILDKRSYKFPNPLFKNEMDVMAVCEQVPGTPVTGRVIFAGEGHFPKGRPERVSLLDTLAGDLGLEVGCEGTPARTAGGSADRYQPAWQRLQQSLVPRSGVPRRALNWRVLVTVLLLAAALVWGGELLLATGTFNQGISTKQGATVHAQRDQ